MEVRSVDSVMSRLFLGALASMGVVVTMTTVPANPYILEHFQTTPSGVALTVTWSMFGAVLGQCFWGPFSDRYGRQRALFWGFWLVGLSSIACFYAPSISFLVAMRTIQGFASNVGLVVVRALCRDLYQGAIFDRMIAWLLTIIPFSAGVAPIVGETLARKFGWGGPFLFLTVFAMLAIAVMPLFLSIKHTAPARSNVPVFLGWRLFLKSKHIGCLICASSLVYASFFVFIPAAPLIYKSVFGLSGWHVAFFLFVFPFGTFCGGLFQCTQGFNYDTHRVATSSYLLSLTALWFNLVLLFFVPSAILYAAFMVIFGAGMAVFNAVCTSRVMRDYPSETSGNLSSLLGVGQTLGSAIGSWISGKTLNPESVVLSIFGLLTIAGICYMISASAVPVSIKKNS